MVSGGRLGRYIGGSVASAIALVALVLTGLYLGVDLVREAGDMAGRYGPLDVAWFLVRTAPARLYDLFPFAVLIGGMVALGRLSARSELVAMRACGFHQTRITAQVMLVALALGLLVMLFGERIAPTLELAARIDRERALNSQVGEGTGQSLWIRDGSRMIHVGMLVWRDDERLRFADLRVYGIAGADRFDAVVHAASARHVEGNWLLADTIRLDPATGEVTRKSGETVMDSQLDPGLFRALATRPRLLPIHDILRIQDYLAADGQDTTAYRQAFWRRLLYPINLVAMLFSGVALLLRAGRRLSPSVGVFAGVSLGIGFVVVHRLMLGVAPVLPLPMGVTHFAPAAVFAIGGLLLLRR